MKSLIVVLLFFSIGCAKPVSNLKDPQSKKENSSEDGSKTPPADDSKEVNEPDPSPIPNDPITGNVVCYLGEKSDNKNCMLTTDINEVINKLDYKYKKPSRFLNNPDQYRRPYHLLDLDSIDLLSKVSPNFQIGEFLVRHKGQYGILAPILIEMLQNIRETLEAAIHINSGYRSPAYNKSVGGANYSRHQYGDAVDMWSDKHSLDELKKECIAKGASFYQLYKTHIHCDWRNDDLNPAFYPPLLDQPLMFSSMAEFKLQSHLEYEKSSNTLYISHPEAEEASSELLYEWTIVTGRGVVKTKNYQPKLNLDGFLDVRAVHVDIGGAVRVSIKF